MVSTAAAIAAHRPERVPARIPALRPARLRSWQGEPPHMMSTGSTVAQSILVMSPRLGVSGQRTSARRQGPGSTSLV